MDKRKSNGGQREGSGRPKLKATTTITFRVLPEHKEAVRAAVRELILNLKKEK